MATQITNAFIQTYQEEVKNLYQRQGSILRGTIRVKDGIVGATTQSRTVDPNVFIGAMRYHTGGMVGLKPGEVPAILQTGEEVLAKGDPRHRSNFNPAATAAAAPTQSVRNVLVIGDDQIAAAMNGSHGETTILTTLKRNASTVRQLIGAK